MKFINNKIRKYYCCIILIAIVIPCFANSKETYQLNNDSLFDNNIFEVICRDFTETSSVHIKHTYYFSRIMQYCEESNKKLILLTQYSINTKSLSPLPISNDTLIRRLYAIKYLKNNTERWSFVIISNFTSAPYDPIIDYSNSFNGDSILILPLKRFKPGIEYRNKQPFAYFKQKPSLNDLKKFLNYDPLKWRIFVDSARGERIIDGVVVEENWRKLFNTKPLPLLPRQ